MPAKMCFASIDVEGEGVEGVNQILGLFKRYNVSATLFVTGEVLEKQVNLVRQWSESHEVACHTFTHRFWNELSLEERKTELDRFATLYQSVFQKKPLGFRAPSHLIDQEGLKLLDEKGFLYDSSVVPHYLPFKKYRGYQGRKPLLPYRPAELKLLEIPVRGQLFGIPLAGAWIRGLPVWLYQALFSFYCPDFITLNMHSWDVKDSRFLEKLEKILKLLKKKNYLFLNGEQILKNQKSN